LVKSFLKDAFIYFIPYVISRGLAFFLTPLFTRILTPDEFGIFDLFIVYNGIVQLTLSLEVSQAVARFFSFESNYLKKIEYASSGFIFTLASLFIFFILLAPFSGKVSYVIFQREGLANFFILAMAFSFFYGGFYFLQNQLRWELRSKDYSVLSLFYTFSTTLSCLYFLYFQNSGLVGLIWGYLVGCIFSFLFGLYQLRNSIKFKFNRHLLLQMILFSLPLVPASIAVWVNGYIDRIMIGSFLTLNEVGIFGVGFRFASVSLLVVSGLQAALTPLVYQNYTNPNTPKEIERIFRFCVGFFLFLFAAVNIYIDDIFVFFATAEYSEAKNIVIFLMPSIILSQMYIFAPGIYIAKKTNLVLIINFAGALIHTLSNFLLIPLLGISGAAISSLVGQFVSFVFYMSISQHYYTIPYDWKKVLIMILYVIFLVLISREYFSDTTFFYYTSAFFIIAIIMGLFFFRFITKSELIDLLQSFRKY